MKAFVVICLMITAVASNSIYIYDFSDDNHLECAIGDNAEYANFSRPRNEETFTKEAGHNATFVIVSMAEFKKMFLEQATKKGVFLKRCYSAYADFMRIHFETAIYVIAAEDKLKYIPKQFELIPEVIHHHSPDLRPLNEYATIVQDVARGTQFRFRGWRIPSRKDAFLVEMYKGLKHEKFFTTLPQISRKKGIDIYYTARKEIMIYDHRSKTNEVRSIPLIDANGLHLKHPFYDFTRGKRDKKVNLFIVETKEFLWIMRDPALRSIYDREAWRCELYTGQTFHLIGAINFNVEDIPIISQFILETNPNVNNVKIMGDRIFDTIYQYNDIEFKSMKVLKDRKIKSLDDRSENEATKGLLDFRSHYLKSAIETESVIYVYDWNSNDLDNRTPLNVHTRNGKYVTDRPDYHFPKTPENDKGVVIIMDVKYTEKIRNDPTERQDFQAIACTLSFDRDVDVYLMGVQNMSQRMRIISEALAYHGNPDQKIATIGYKAYDTYYEPFQDLTDEMIDQYMGRFSRDEPHSSRSHFRIFDATGQLVKNLTIHTLFGEYIRPDDDNFLLNPNNDKELKLIILNTDTFEAQFNDVVTLTMVHGHVTKHEPQTRLLYVVCHQNFNRDDDQLIAGMIDAHRGQTERYQIAICTERAIGSVFQHKNFWPFRLWKQEEIDTILGYIYRRM